MRHYEVVVLVHPDQSAQVEGMMGRYRTMIEQGNGKIHRAEDWGRRPLAYIINKVRKAHYFMMNIECDQPVLDELEGAFRYNDAILRKLVIRRKEALTDKTPMAFEAEEEARNKLRRGNYPRSNPAKSAVPAVAPKSVSDDKPSATEEK